MRLWPWKRRDERKYSEAGPLVASWTTGIPVWTPRDYKHLADESYLRNAVAYRCVKLIATSAASVPWLLYGRRGKEIEDHPILDLLSRPAPGFGGATFFEAVYAYFLLAGNSYIEAVGPDNGAPKELWALRPDRMRVIPGRFGLPEGYQYEANGLQKLWNVDPATGFGPVLHLKDFHPTDDWYGMSRIDAAAYGVDRHNAASIHNKSLLDNGARPSGALVFKPVKVGESEYQTAPPEMIEAASKRLASERTGPAAAGKPFVFSGDVAWEEMAVTPKDMDFQAGKEDAARDICTAMGVPHILIVPGATTYNNVSQAKLDLYEGTVLPLVDQAADALNAWLCPRYGDQLRLGIDEDAIPALESKREARRTSVSLLLDKGVIDADEARDALGYGPRPEGAVKKVDASLVTALLGVAEEVGIGPLARYLKSVGLIDADITDEEILRVARSMGEDEDPEPSMPPDPSSVKSPAS